MTDKTNQLLFKTKRKIKSVASKFFKSEYQKIYEKYKKYTLIPEKNYIDILKLSLKVRDYRGNIVECGCYNGGLSAGLAELHNQTNFFLYDSFEGLPEAKEIDGEKAKAWQADKDSKWYFNNCKADYQLADEAMKLSKANYQIRKGWFENTLDSNMIIKFLVIDGDWYDSVKTCLEKLYDSVDNNGIIVIDDYYLWDGCSTAVNEFLGKNKIKDRIRQLNDNIAYIKAEHFNARKLTK